MGLEHFDTVLSFAVLMLLLSLQITLLVQIAVAISGLRGWNLSWSLTTLLEQIDPKLNLKHHAKRLSREILEHPAITHTRSLIGRRKATAIRLEELLRVMEDLGKNSPLNQEDESKQDDNTKQALQALTEALKITVTDKTPQMAKIGSEVVEELTKLFPAEKQAVQEAVNKALRKKKQVEVEIKAWFDTVMDRSTDRFILHTRWITAGIAFALAFTLHIDSIQIFKQLSSSSELRGRLIQQMDVTLEQASAVIAGMQKPKPLASKAILSMEEDMEEAKDKNRLKEVPLDLVTRQEGEDWLRKNFTGPTLTKMLSAYEKRFQESTIDRLKELGVSLDEVKSSADQARLQIIPQKLAWKEYTGKEELLHILGILMSGLFLSLGAPFWFNALRQLANLRPMLAGKVEKETTEQTKEGKTS
jgi:hypothetical protein